MIIDLSTFKLLLGKARQPSRRSNLEIWATNIASISGDVKPWNFCNCCATTTACRAVRVVAQHLMRLLKVENSISPYIHYKDAKNDLSLCLVKYIESTNLTPNQQQGRSVRVNRQRRRRGRKNPGDSVGKYASDAWSLAKRTAYGLNEIRKLINIETKILESSGSAPIDTSGIISTLNNVVQGLDYTNRIGDSIKLQRIEIRIAASMGSTGTKTFLRIMLVRDLDNYGTKPTVADILQTVHYLAPKKYLNNERFAVLYDELECLSSINDTNTITHIDMPHSGHIKFLGTTAADASNGKGSLYILWLSNEAAGTNAPTVAFNSRLYFTDD